MPTKTVVTLTINLREKLPKEEKNITQTDLLHGESREIFRVFCQKKKCLEFIKKLEQTFFLELFSKKH